MMQNATKIASAIVFLYGLLLVVPYFLAYPISLPTWYLKLAGMAPVFVAGIISWGLWRKRQWAWRLALAGAAVQLALNISGLYTLYAAFKNVAGAKIFYLPKLQFLLATSFVGMLLLVLLLIVLLSKKTRTAFFDADEGISLPTEGPVSKAGLMNIAIATGFALAALTSIGGHLVKSILPASLLHNIPHYQGHLLSAFANYWLPALAIYLVFRMVRAESWFKPRPAIHVLLAIANTLMVLYVLARVFASTVEGGGASFAVAQFSVIFIYPARLLILMGLAWLIVRSGGLKLKVLPVPMSASEIFVIFLALVIPAAFISSFYIGENAPMRLVNEANKIFNAKCLSVSESLHKKPLGDVESIFIEKDSAVNYSLKDGHYSSTSVSSLGAPLVNSRLLVFTESPDRSEEPEAKYRRYYFNDYKGQSTDSLHSRYGVFTTELTNESEKGLGVTGAQVSIVDLETRETIATTRYFANAKEREFCGVGQPNQFSTTNFVMRALDLKRR